MENRRLGSPAKYVIVWLPGAFRAMASKLPQKATVLGDEDDTWQRFIHHPRIIILIILMTLRMTQIPLYGLGLIDSSVPRLRGLSGF